MFYVFFQNIFRVGLARFQQLNCCAFWGTNGAFSRLGLILAAPTCTLRYVWRAALRERAESLDHKRILDSGS